MELQEYHNLRQIEDTHFWFRSLHELVLHTLQRQSSDGTLTMLDAGCGTGGLAKKLEMLGVVECIDSSETAIRYCRERGLTHARVEDLNTVTLQENRYDAIVSLDVLYHRGIRDVGMVLRTFFTALKPGGMLFLHLPAFEAFRSYHDACVHTRQRFRLQQTKKLVRGADFRVEHGSYRITLLLPAILLLRSLRALKTSEHSDLQPLHPFINIPLLFVSRLENALTRLIPMPIGLSLYVIARKPLD